MITTALLLTIALGQTATRLNHPYGPGDFAALLGDKVELRFTDNPQTSWCAVRYDTATSQIEMPCAIHPAMVNTNALSAGALTLTPGALPTCSTVNAGQLAYNSVDGLHYGCGPAGWVALSNPAPNPTLSTQRTTFTPPTSLGVLGVGNTTSSMVAAAGVPVGADCVVTCPLSVVGKVVWSCDVPTAGQFRVIGTSTTAVAITLPANQQCSVRALWMDTAGAASLR